jgi:hypothetical protein
MSREVFVVVRLDWDEVDHRSEIGVIGVYLDENEAEGVRYAQEATEPIRDTVFVFVQKCLIEGCEWREQIIKDLCKKPEK